jgi:hypothetical protein
MKLDAIRKAFEGWARDQGFELRRTLDGKDYQDLRTQGPWDAWHACAKAEREACAKVCDEISEKATAKDNLIRSDIAYGKSVGAESCAEAIRARQ